MDLLFNLHLQNMDSIRNITITMDLSFSFDLELLNLESITFQILFFECLLQGLQPSVNKVSKLLINNKMDNLFDLHFRILALLIFN